MAPADTHAEGTGVRAAATAAEDTAIDGGGVAAQPGSPDSLDIGPARPSPLSGHVMSWGLTLLVGLAALALRLVNLGRPPGKIFDETYYATDAWSLLQHGVETTEEGGPAFVVHPPLGKWAIALGQWTLGNNEQGWRVSAAVAGAITVVVLVRAVARLVGSLPLGVVAGVLLATDGLHLVQSRVAMLDVFLVLWISVAFSCLLVDRDRARELVAGHTPGALRYGPGLGLLQGMRWWRLAAAVALGAAIATKWSAAWYVIALTALALVWDLRLSRRSGARMTRTLRLIPGWVLAFVAIPALVYLVSWSGWFAADADTAWGRDREVAVPAMLAWVPQGLRALYAYHREMLQFHTGLNAEHAYASGPFSWLLLLRPVLYYWESSDGCGDRCVEAVHALGTPLLWWGFLVAIPVVVWAAWRRRDERAHVVLVGMAAGLLPWLLTPGRTMFAFYALPALPFMIAATVLTIGYALGPATPDRVGRRRLVVGFAAAGYVVLVVANLAYVLPVLTGEAIPYQAWLDRMWLHSWI